MAAHTVRSALVLCGVNDAPPLWEQMTDAQRIASDLFDDDFNTCMDKTFSDLDEDWKTYSNVTQAQGQIRLLPGVKKKIRAFIQWTRDRIRLGEDPAGTPFPADETADILRRYHTHKNWLDKAKEKASTALPKTFTDKIKWLDWRDTFIMFLRTQPGRNGVPLSYIIRKNEEQVLGNNVEFLDDYANMAPMNGPAFAADAAEVHTYIVNLISGNSTAENKILPYLAENNGRKDFLALKEHYEGVGAHAKAIVEAENDIATLYYTGEKKPHMWWEEFETRLTTAFAVIDKSEDRIVYSDVAKLRMLILKVRADFLDSTRSAIEMEMTKTPITLTFEQALTNYRNAVNRKFPNDQSASKRTRRVNKVKNNSQKNKQGNHNQNNGNDAHSKGNLRKRSDSWQVIGTDGSKIDVHPAYHFDSDVWQKIPFPVRTQLTEMRQAFNKKKRSQKQVVTNNNDTSGNQDPSNNNNTEGTIMGGRNEQAKLKSRT